MKRAILAVSALLVVGCLAGTYGYFVVSWDNSHRELIQLGDEAMAKGDYSGAIEEFSGAIALRGDSMVAYLKRGEAYHRRDEPDAALRDLRRAAELDPGAPRPRELLGDVNYARNRFVPAIEHYQAYVDLDDQSPRVLYKLGLAQYRAGQPLRGITALQKAVAIDDQFGEAYYVMGLCQRDAQKTSDALTSLARAIKLAPALLPAREELAHVYARLGRTDDWLTQLDALRALDPTAARDVTLGLAYAKAGQFDRAVLTLRQAAQRYPDHRYTYVALGRVWLETAEVRADRVELNKALEALEHAIALERTSEAYTLFGRALLLSSNDELAERILSEASETLPADPMAFYYLAEAAERRGHIDVARQALLDYFALEGEGLDARRVGHLAVRVADWSMRVSDFTLAATWYERAVAAMSSDDNLVVRLAEARWRTGQIDVAKAMLDKLLEKDAANVAARALRRRIR